MLEQAETTNRKYFDGFPILEPCQNHSDCLSQLLELFVEIKIQMAEFLMCTLLTFGFDPSNEIQGPKQLCFVKLRWWDSEPTPYQ